MKVRIEIDEKLTEDEVLIRCSRLDEKAQKVYETLQEITKETKRIIFYKGNTEFYFPLENILFFETTDNCVSAHTVDSIYQTEYRLYELEEMLPGFFMRVSNHPKPYSLKCGRVYRHPQTGICFQILL